MLVLLAACDREAPRDIARPDEACVFDEIGALRLEWSVPDVCESDLNACRTACFDGNAEACFYTATKNTAAGEDDEADPMPLYERACKGGLAIGCTNWAAGYLLGGYDVEHQPPLGCLYRLFAKACNAGEPFGCSMTARMHLEWPRTAIDKWIGFNQLANACDRFDGPPCRFLAYYLERGEFGVADPSYVKLLLQRACDGDDEEACGKERAADTLHGP
jgi:uncharacterized protein